MIKYHKNIVIDGTPAINDIRAIKRYCHHLVLELDQLETDLQFQMLYLCVKRNSQAPSIRSSKTTQIISKIPGGILSPLWSIFNAPKISHWAKEPFELVHFPGGLPYIPTHCPKVLTTLHGFASYYIPEYIDNKVEYKAKKQLDLTIKKSTNLITVSETNKSEIMKLWNIPSDMITPIPLGISPDFKIYNLQDEVKQSMFKQYNLHGKPFILFVGALEPHKNIKNIILGYHQLSSNLKKRYQLVLVGKETTYCKGYREQIISLGLSDNVTFIDYIQPGSIDLAYLYNMAKIFIFPTFYEGWASPPLEAMKCGTPAVVSDIPSLHESTGEISSYPNPKDPQAIALKMQELLEDKKLYEKQRLLGIKFTEQYTWKKCAESTLKLYQNLVLTDL